MINESEKLVRAIIIIGVLGLGFFSLFAVHLGQAATVATFTVNSVDDTDDGTCDGGHCSLREAIDAANNAAGPDTINFSLSPTSTISLYGDELPVISDTLTIDGSTAENLTIDGNHFQVSSGAVITITSLTKSGIGNKFGGGVLNNGELNVIDSKFVNNVVYGDGGGIYNLGGTVNIIRTTISKNYAQFSGGGIYNNGGSINIRESTIDGNITFSGDGGGINNLSGEIFVDNSTISGNLCSRYHSYCYGGGIYNLGSRLHFNSSTVSGNWAEGGMDGVPPFGGGIYGGEVNLVNTILANNLGGDCEAGSMPTNINNLIEDGSCDPAFSGDPLLGPLQDNGGPTWTHALSSISLAIDNGDNAACAALPVNNFDQRGVTRPFDGNGDGAAICDIGAFEYDGPPPSHSFMPLVVQN